MPYRVATGYSEKSTDDDLIWRRPIVKEELEDADNFLKDDAELYDKVKNESAVSHLDTIVMPIIFTVLGMFTRMYKIGRNNHVVWDEEMCIRDRWKTNHSNQPLSFNLA